MRRRNEWCARDTIPGTEWIRQKRYTYFCKQLENSIASEFRRN